MSPKVYIVEQRKKGGKVWRAMYMPTSKKDGLAELRVVEEHHIDCDTSEYRLSTYQRVEGEVKP